VESQVNLIVMPAGPDPETAAELRRLEQDCQRASDEIFKPVKLLMHQGLPREFAPRKRGKVRATSNSN